MKTFSKTSINIKAITFSLLFLFSSIGASVLISPASASPNSASAATPLTSLEANWTNPNGNAFLQNYNPQNVINSSNAQNLGIAWLFPLPTHPTALLNVAGGLGVGSTPLIINGTIYAITQFYQVFALNAANGNVIWTDVIPINQNSSQGQATGPVSLHLHDGPQQYTTTLFNHTPTLWYQDGANRVWAINAINGHYELNFTDFTGLSMVDGNSPTSVYHGVGGANILVDQNRGIIITSHGAETSADNGRCFYRAWNVLVNPPTPLWTTYCTPPQPHGNVPTDPNWTVNQVNSMKGAQIFYPPPATWIAGGYVPNDHGQAVVNLKTISAAQLNSTLYNDWGYVNQSPTCAAATGGASTGSTGAGWGGGWILGSGPTKGIVYVNTNNRDPYGFGSCTPGPDLWAASLLSLNETTGAWIWGFQSSPHDVWDYDCSWWQAAGNQTINGVSTPVILKTCKPYFYEINALTGNLIYAWSPPTSIIPRCQYCAGLNPLNRTQMTQEFFTPDLSTALMYPAAVGTFENEGAYSPSLNYLFFATENDPTLTGHLAINSSNYHTTNGWVNPNGYVNFKESNTTAEAVNAATGQMVWSKVISTYQGYRGGVTTSGNVVYFTMSSGNMMMLDAKTGNVIKDFFIGGPLNVLPAVGATSSGQMEVIVPLTAGLVSWGTGVPGDLVALNLQTPSSPGTTTNTVTTSVTVSGGTTTVTTGGAGTTSVTTATVTASGGGGGVSTTTLYGVAAVAVIFIIATGYLAMRGRKPAS